MAFLIESIETLFALAIFATVSPDLTVTWFVDASAFALTKNNPNAAVPNVITDLILFDFKIINSS
ncbi:hypothetical protein [Lactobacillus sp. S2-2]|uniref:hypothetical protein n=1 Tax=Lactobacillus sp. S2-2 TaxID=2692917 RepID=UPI00351D8C37